MPAPEEGSDEEAEHEPDPSPDSEVDHGYLIEIVLGDDGHSNRRAFSASRWTCHA